MNQKSPFPSRPWMNQLGAAAAGGEGNKGLKGIVAGYSSQLLIWRIYIKNQYDILH